ncbi:MAG TPA: CGNR zinc finger domain-containing protein [Nitrospira sp.]|nr:CGNR zinc finger domain-containing protein [Nitrospira sp.]
MNAQNPPTAFLFVGNHPCLDFVNTQLVTGGQPVETLASYSDVVRWLVEAKLLTGDAAKRYVGRGIGPEQEARILERARAFRATLRDMVERIASGKPVPQAALDAINGMLRHRLGCPVVLRGKDGFERGVEPASHDPAQVLGLLAEAAADLLCRCDLSLIKPCQNPACVLFFYDTSKNHTRQWCSMNLCGNRSKVAAHYRRHRRRKS